MNKPLWQPSEKAIANSQMTQFIKQVNETHQANVSDYPGLHAWSVKNPEKFWASLWDFGHVISSKKATQILVDGDNMEKATWFVDAKLNFAENLLRRRDDHLAIIFVAENKKHSELSYQELFHQVAVWAEQLRPLGVKSGDRVVGFYGN